MFSSLVCPSIVTPLRELPMVQLEYSYCLGLMCGFFVSGGFASHVFLYSGLPWVYVSPSEKYHNIMNVEHYSLGGCAAWSADACTFLICFRLLSCVYTYVMSTWSMPWAGSLSRIWRNSPRGWLVPISVWMGCIPCPCPVGWPDSVFFSFFLAFLPYLTVSPS